VFLVRQSVMKSHRPATSASLFLHAPYSGNVFLAFSGVKLFFPANARARNGNIAYNMKS